MKDSVTQDRRSFLRISAAAAAAVGSSGLWSTSAVAAVVAAPWKSLSRVDAGDLSIEYAELGPRTGAPVILLHGWPYDIHSFVEVAPALAAKGHRVLVPYLRGFGGTRFRSTATPRNAQPAAMAADVIALMDALGLRKAVLAGFDWGARSADVVAALFPERCQALVVASGYLLGSPQANAAPLPPKAEILWWHQYGAPRRARPSQIGQFQHRPEHQPGWFRRCWTRDFRERTR